MSAKRQYPVMPPGCCRESSWTLAACYRELEYAEGYLIVTIQTTERPVSDKHEHAWNVTAGGDIVDSTLALEIRALVDAGKAELAYEATDPATWWIAAMPDAARAMAAAATLQTRGKSPGERRRIVEAFGRMFAATPGEDDVELRPPAHRRGPPWGLGLADRPVPPLHRYTAGHGRAAV
jgi:hypothetical protein